MIKKFLLLLCIGLLQFQAYSIAQTLDLKRIDLYLQKTMKEWQTPGMAVGIVQNGKLVFAKGYGTREVGKNHPPDPNTLFAIASISKAFTAASLALLVQQGKLDWEDKVQEYVPYFQLYDEYVSAQTTIRDLLCHRVGLGTFSGDVIWYKSSLTPEEIIRRVRYLEPAYDFRAGYGYSNVMYVTAGKIIEEISGMSWGDFVNNNFFQPLGMKRTISSIDNLESKGNFATPHALSNGENRPIEWTDWNSVAPMGGIISSIEDMSKWMAFNMNYGIVNGDTLLAPEVYDQLWKPWNSFQLSLTNPDRSSHFSGYGLGWRVTDYHGKLRVGHSGGYDGMISYLQLLPEEKFGVIVLTNGLKTPIRAVTDHIIDSYLGLPEKDHSAEYLQNYLKNVNLDRRIADRIEARITGTEPTLSPESYTGTYFTEVYGNIYISNENDQLFLEFEHSPALNAKLSHWHYDVWKIEWGKNLAWFEFGTVQFNLNNNLEVQSITFDVPNDDIWFYELKPQKVKQE